MNVINNNTKCAYVVGTFDTKQNELNFVRDVLIACGVKIVTVDLSTLEETTAAQVNAREVAGFHPAGVDAVFTGDRGSAVTEMATAFVHFITAQKDVGGLISLGGSGGTALATPAMQSLPIGLPKVMVSTVASGDVSGYVGPSDICMIYSVTDVAGLNRISQPIFSNAANALAGMMNASESTPRESTVKKAIGLTMFGVTTPCVQLLSNQLQDEFDCVVFHATGTGGKSMEKLIDAQMFAGVLDVTTTEVCDLLMGGVMRADEDRFGAVIREKIPFIGSCGALDMVNFGALETVPEKYKDRNLYVHNAQVTLMRTTPKESQKIGEWIGAKLNQCAGEVRFFIPENGVSMLDAPGMQFYDPQANEALFDALYKTVKQTERRKLIKLSYHINDEEFASALAAEFNRLMHDNA